jgi:hypothetical protein
MHNNLMGLPHATANLRADLGSDCLINGFRRLRRLREQRIGFSDLLLGEIAILDGLGVFDKPARGLLALGGIDFGAAATEGASRTASPPPAVRGYLLRSPTPPQLSASSHRCRRAATRRSR